MFDSDATDADEDHTEAQDPTSAHPGKATDGQAATFDGIHASSAEAEDPTVGPPTQATTELPFNPAGNSPHHATTNPKATTATGDPVTTAAAGDPVTTAAAADPVTTTAAGDPVTMQIDPTISAKFATTSTTSQGTSANVPSKLDASSGTAPTAAEDSTTASQGGSSREDAMPKAEGDETANAMTDPEATINNEKGTRLNSVAFWRLWQSCFTRHLHDCCCNHAC